MVSFTTTLVAAAAVLSTSVSALSGDMTYYNPNGNLGSCGSAIQNSQLAVALPSKYGKSHCGGRITISSGGKTVSGVQVLDTCPGCAGDSIDVTPTVFQRFAALSVGRLHNVQWNFS